LSSISAANIAKRCEQLPLGTISTAPRTSGKVGAVEIDDVIGVVAHDDIGREFREPAGTLRKILQDWSAKDGGGRGSKPSIETK
jgi:hypothetical protein